MKVAVVALALAAVTSAASAEAGIRAYLDRMWPDASASGITRETFTAATSGLTPDPKVVALTKRQPEYGKPVGVYLAEAVNERLIGEGQRRAARHARVLEAGERRFGVDRAVVVAIWGIESGYGAFSGSMDVFRSVATLAHAGYREEFFRGEMIAAMRVLQEGHVPRGRMRGSWAGAMGQTQFMPSSFLRYAVDGSGDGLKDLWDNEADVFASTANYLREHGWIAGLPWGYEVAVPEGHDPMSSRMSFAAWVKAGIRRADGRALPTQGEATLLYPSGHAGPGFLVTTNFEVVKSYNNSDAYALAVLHMADRIKGGGRFRATWPATPPLPRVDRIELQRRMMARGILLRALDGRIDLEMRDAIRRVQRDLGLFPDGHPTADLLARL